MKKKDFAFFFFVVGRSEDEKAKGELPTNTSTRIARNKKKKKKKKKRKKGGGNS
jgi:hypothetical protein